jgi:hypothetical protein
LEKNAFEELESAIRTSANTGQMRRKSGALNLN